MKWFSELARDAQRIADGVGNIYRYNTLEGAVAVTSRYFNGSLYVEEQNKIRLARSPFPSRLRSFKISLLIQSILYSFTNHIL